MNRINILNEETSNKIAAGEVVERPFSVVKELIENSIDAGAKNISIEISDGGQKLIQVIDDGHGIHPDDISTAFLPHATSKIRVIDDIFKISTFGFRGEALASIASVARVKLKSRTREHDYGKEIEINGGAVESIKDVGCNIGTYIEVRDLFYNVPARLKFMKSVSKETSSVTDIVSRLALCNNDISFKYVNNNKKVLQTYGNGKLLDSIRIIYGKNVADNLIYFESHSDLASVFGYVGNQDISRGSRNHQSIYVNKRYIKSKLITAAVENAMKSFLTINKFPFFVLFLDIYPELIDVNIHPTKAEVKFNDDRFIFKFIFDAVHQGMRESLKDTFMVETDSIEKVPTVNNVKTEVVEAISFHNIIQTNTLDEVKNETVSLPIDLSRDKDSNFYLSQNTFDNLSQRDNKLYEKNSYNEKNEVSTIREDSIKENPVAKLPDLKYIGIFNNTYIICEYNTELYVIDQHAAHERVLFEKYREEIKRGQVISQIVLTPIVMELSLEDFIIYSENEELFERTGFDIELFGDNTIQIRQVPYILGKLDGKNFLLQMIDGIRNFGKSSTVEVKYDNIARMACRSAVKAQDKLSYDEVKKLLEDLNLCENPFNCPHGRPTIIKMSLNEIEKRFKRIQ
ncbi:MAG: DNA mismatch repair endonuclease MutL [Clostridiales bacterium]|nr:DNA mismatch repair endonuclease MutL [Clostridiales bacterium]